MSKRNTIAKILLSTLLATGVAGCASKDASSTSSEEIVHEKGDRETLDDGSIKVYLDNGASFVVEEGTSDDEIENYIEMFSASLEDDTTDDGVEVTEEAQTDAAAEESVTEGGEENATDESTDETAGEVQGDIVTITDDAATAVDESATANEETSDAMQ